MKNNIRINVIVNIIRTLVLTLLSFITFPWVCRYLGEAVVGTYTWANTFVAYFLILAKIGIPNLAVRECVKVRHDKELLSNINADTNLVIRNSNVVKNPTPEYKTLAEIEDRANATFNLLLRKNTTIPNFAPDLYTQTIKYIKQK